MSSSQSDKTGSDAEMGEATSQVPGLVPSDSAPACVADLLSFREKLARRKAEKEPIHDDTELPSSSVLVVTPTHEPEVQVPQGAGAQVETGVSCVPDASAQPSGSSMTPILVDGKETTTESMPPLPARKDIVLALGNDGESSQQEGLSLASGFRGKFVSLIDGMISECGSKVSRLTRDLTEMQGKFSESEAMLKAIEDSHSAKVSKLEVQIGELKRDLGKMASSLLKEKRPGRPSPRRDLALAAVDGGMAVVQALQGETSSSLQAEEARLSACKGALAGVDGSFDLILADLKSECFLPTCLEDPEEKDPAVGENEGSAAPSLDEAMDAIFVIHFESFISEDVEWKDLGLLLVLRGAMTNLTYVSRYSFDLIPYRFKVQDRFSAYMTCLVGIEQLSKDNF
ncbi:hypothetical protein F2Q68_00033951 [Brassica cretica]|uniref:Uncharacterized protein n=1 Tax=Brassica cretica TaxID=69181 RepID=A0A8S9GT93_BRACR|nr:hypothetical protein F2Q68_00033951 [Brassica cretica]